MSTHVVVSALKEIITTRIRVTNNYSQLSNHSLPPWDPVQSWWIQSPHSPLVHASFPNGSRKNPMARWLFLRNSTNPPPLNRDLRAPKMESAFTDAAALKGRYAVDMTSQIEVEQLLPNKKNRKNLKVLRILDFSHVPFQLFNTFLALGWPSMTIKTSTKHIVVSFVTTYPQSYLSTGFPSSIFGKIWGSPLAAKDSWLVVLSSHLPWQRQRLHLGSARAGSCWYRICSKEKQ